MTVELTWDAMPEEQQIQQAEPQQPQSGNNNNGYTNPYALFDYFFGNRGW